MINIHQWDGLNCQGILCGILVKDSHKSLDPKVTLPVLSLATAFKLFSHTPRMLKSKSNPSISIILFVDYSLGLNVGK